MYVCPSVCGQLVILTVYNLLKHEGCPRIFKNVCIMFQNVPECSRMFQNVPECMQNVQECMENVPECMQNVPECMQNILECMQNVPEFSKMHAECFRMF